MMAEFWYEAELSAECGNIGGRGRDRKATVKFAVMEGRKGKAFNEGGEGWTGDKGYVFKGGFQKL